MDRDMEMPEPAFPVCPPWSLIERLNKEKDILGIFISAHPLDEYKFVLENFTTCTMANVPNFKDTPLKLAGIVTKAEHKISKKGTGYGNFVIEDYFGSFEFPLFSEEYLDFKNRLEVGQMVYIKATNRSFQDGATRFKLQSVQQLASAGSTVSEGIMVKVPVQTIDEKKIAKLKELIESQRGNSALRIVLHDMVSQNYLYLLSNEYKVEVNHHLLAEFQSMGFDYKLN